MQLGLKDLLAQVDLEAASESGGWDPARHPKILQAFGRSMALLMRRHGIPKIAVASGMLFWLGLVFVGLAPFFFGNSMASCTRSLRAWCFGTAVVLSIHLAWCSPHFELGGTLGLSAVGGALGIRHIRVPRLSSCVTGAYTGTLVALSLIHHLQPSLLMSHHHHDGGVRAGVPEELARGSEPPLIVGVVATMLGATMAWVFSVCRLRDVVGGHRMPHVAGGAMTRAFVWWRGVIRRLGLRNRYWQHQDVGVRVTVPRHHGATLPNCSVLEL
jgi:hypothetical protein